MPPSKGARTGGRVALITGATAGIGRQAALELARKGISVIIVGRDPERGEAAAAALARESRNDNVSFEHADVASQLSVRDLAARVAERHERLDILINNVAALYVQRELTVDGVEATLAVTHLASYLLTQLLLPVLEKTGAARVVNVTSGTMTPAMMGPVMRAFSAVYAPIMRLRSGSVERAASALVRAATAADLEQRTDLYVTAKKASGFARALTHSSPPPSAEYPTRSSTTTSVSSWPGLARTRSPTSFGAVVTTEGHGTVQPTTPA